jgi:CRISPR-associated protein, NE0113 family
MSQKRKILLSVTGMSPAVVTETLYALVTEKGFIPTEIQVITTEQGKNKLLEALLGIEGGRKERKGALQEFIKDYGDKYGFSSIHFDESCIHIITDESGQNLPDIRTPEENEHAANSIVQLVGNLCQDEEMQLHVSIAGGRKTMGFFMGYALSLYGREQDSLSHVLVDSQYESLASFYYPKPYPHLINKNDGTQIDAKDGKVMLAEIPWVRLGLGLPESLTEQKVSYSQSVKNAQKLLTTPKVTFLSRAKTFSNLDAREILFGDDIKIRFAPREYAYFVVLLIFKRKGITFDMNNQKSYNLILEYFAKIMSELKNSSVDELLEDYQSNTVRFPNLIRDAKGFFSDKLEKAFSGKSRYIPYSRDSKHYLDIDLENIDMSLIDNELKNLKLL